MSAPEGRQATMIPVHMMYKLGEAIYPCRDCMYWSAVVYSPSTTEVEVIEYHQANCELVDCPDCHGHVQPGHYCPECGLCDSGDGEHPETP